MYTKFVFYILFILFIGCASGQLASVFKAMIVPLGIETMLLIYELFKKCKENIELTKPNWYLKLKHFNETKLTWISKEEKERIQKEKAEREQEALNFLINRIKERHKIGD